VTGPLAEPERVAFAGCWHGNTNYAEKAIRYAADQGAQVIVHTGDLQYWVRSAAMEALSVTLYRHGLRMLWVDGNHDDHPGLAHLAPDGHGLGPVADQIWHLPRGYRWTWGGLRFLALGGAHSIDRRFRTPGQDWWPQEAITPVQALAAIAQGPADVMVTHDCPSGVTPAGLVTPLPSAWVPEEPAADAHRALLGSVVDEVGPAWLIHGHYHARYTAHRAGPSRTCQVEGLSREGDSLANNIAVWDLAEMRRVTQAADVEMA
jgi:Calcineurin-like phosphoesterase